MSIELVTHPWDSIAKRLNLKLLRRIFILLVSDGLSFIVAYLGAFLLRYPVQTWQELIPLAYTQIPEFLIIGWIVFFITGMYRTLWRYASVDAVFIIGLSTVLAVTTPFVALLILNKFIPNWSIFVIQWLLLLFFVSAGRFSLRYLHTLGATKQRKGRKRILIFGAGNAGEMICRDLQRNKSHQYNLVGFIDDDPTKQYSQIHKVPVLGGRDALPKIVEQKEIHEIIIALPSLSGAELRKLHDILKDLVNGSVVLKTLPGISELMDGKITMQQIRRLRVRDLLRREPVELDTTAVDGMLHERTVFISGAGGSIGSEICRQVCRFSPKRLILFDISEASLYLILEELENRFGDIEMHPVVGDIGHRTLVEKVFSDFSPEIVFHAAAYKHVPMMEFNPWSAVHNNVRGTRVLSEISAQYGVERFVLISTDKAVRPSSMMGATKRICETVVQMQEHDPDSVFTIVRFGNVMGSSGSVIPKFERQIRAGGPVTVTDRKTTRYFMLTSEAVQLVMQAATLDENDAIYLLDMGEPVSIAEIAKDMIRLSGFVPDIDINIEYVGLRPGEKLHEELYHSGLGEFTSIEKITVTHESVYKPERFHANLDYLTKNSFKLSREELFYGVAAMVPDYSGVETISRGLRYQKKRRPVSGKTPNLKTA